MAEIETDKATMEFEAVDEGVIASIDIAEGTEGVKVGTVIATLASEDDDAAAAPAEAKPETAPKPAQAAPVEAPAPAPAPSAPSSPSPTTGTRQKHVWGKGVSVRLE